MKRKVLVLALTLSISTTAFVGCGPKATPTPTTPPPAATSPAPTTPVPTTPAPTTPAPGEKKTDVVTTASIVDNNAAFEKAISKNGTWIIAILKDMTFDKELVVEGEFKNGKKDPKTGAELLQRKIALYTQDANFKVTGKFTLTAPKITFNSPFGSLEHGTFKGDVYVAGKNFKLVNQKINGNIYFLNQEAKDTFTIQDKADDDKTVITGVQELKK